MENEGKSLTGRLWQPTKTKKESKTKSIKYDVTNIAPAQKAKSSDKTEQAENNPAPKQENAPAAAQRSKRARHSYVVPSNKKLKNEVVLLEINIPKQNEQPKKEKAAKSVRHPIAAVSEVTAEEPKKILPAQQKDILADTEKKIALSGQKSESKPAEAETTAAKQGEQEEKAVPSEQKAVIEPAKAEISTPKQDEEPERTEISTPAKYPIIAISDVVPEDPQKKLPEEKSDISDETEEKAVPSEQKAVSEPAETETTAAKQDEPQEEEKASDVDEIPEAVAPEAVAEELKKVFSAKQSTVSDDTDKTPEEKWKIEQEKAAALREQERVELMTRTVQLSIEQILAKQAEMDAIQPQQAEQPVKKTEEPLDKAAENEDIPSADDSYRIEQPVTAGNVIRRGFWGLVRWGILVLVLVLLIAAGGIYWLYQQATPDMIPSITVKFDGQTLEPASYDWKVPVVGNKLKRSYAETVSTSPQELQDVDVVSPRLSISSEEYETNLLILDADGNTVFNDTAKMFSSFRLGQNGTYTAKLVLTAQNSEISGSSEVSGSQTYCFSFALDVKPTVRLSTSSISQGNVVAVRVLDYYGEELPVLKTELADTVFVKNDDGYVAYLPIAADAEEKDYVIQVSAGKYTEAVTLTVTDGKWPYKDYSSSYQMYSPYVGGDTTPEEVLNVLKKNSADGILWAETEFVQPFAEKATILLPFGTIEYVGRSASARANNEGTGRQANNILVSTTYGSDVLSPADGVILLAEDLGGDAGNTVVVDHGGNVRSVFYCLATLDVKQGDTVKRGGTLGTANRYMVCGAAIGTTSVEPTCIWRNQCDALKLY